MQKTKSLFTSARLILAAVVSLCAAGALADCYRYDTNGGTANLGATTQINSRDRFIIYQGTVNLNEGAFIKAGGDAAGACNFIGIDKNAGSALNINGGTFWCATANGSGVLGIGNNNRAQTSWLTLNSGILKVDTQLRSSTQWSGLAGATSSGTVNVNGGEATVKQFVFGSSSQSTGTSTLNLNGGVLTVEEMNFQPYNGQLFNWSNGSLVAARANVFAVNAYRATNKTRTMQVIGNPASFDTAGFDQSIPDFTGEGKLRLTGDGAVTFGQSTLTYGLIFDGIALNLGTLDAGAARLTVPSLEIIGPATLNVTLPASPTGRYPLIACTSSLDGSLGQLSVSGGGAGVIIRDGNTIYLSFDPADATAALVYSVAAGGADTPAQSSYSRLVFTGTAGAFTVGGDGLTFTQDVADQSAAAQTVAAPVTLSTAGSSIYVAEGGSLTLSGGLTATTPIKEGKGTLVLSGATMPASITPKEGTLDLGGNTLAGMLNLRTRRFHGEEITLTNGTWRANDGFYCQGSTIIVADGFTIDLAAANARAAIGYAGVDGDGSATTRLVIDGGTFKAAGNRSNACNFVGVDRWGTSILEVRRGTFHATGANACIRIGVNNRTNQTGIVRVSGGLFKIDNDLSLATQYNGTSGATSDGRFELSGGVGDVNCFYLGGTSSSSGSGTVNLTGGVLEVGRLQCLAYNTQTLVADGATIRAKRDDTAAAPFIAAAASADDYAKSYTIGAGGLTVDTAGHAVHCNIPWTGEGGLTVMGEGGSLALSGSPAFTGDVVISNAAALVVTNSAAFAGKIVLGGANAKIRFDTAAYQEDTLTLAASDFTLPEGVDSVLDLVELVGEGYIVSLSEDGKSIVLSLAANVAAFAWWTGAGDPSDFSDAANWACTNSSGAVVENALPVKSTVVVIDGNTSFSVPSGTTPIWVSTQIGNGGAVTLGADCDWAALPHVTIANGSYIDLNGHDLKISNLTAVEGHDNAYVTNSVSGTKPALWAENFFSESQYIDTAKVAVYTDCVEVKSVNGVSFSVPYLHLATTMDAGCVVAGGVMTVAAGPSGGDFVYLGGNGHMASFCVSNNASAVFSGLRVGNGASGANVVVADNATLRLNNFLTVGHHNSAECVLTQNGGSVSTANDFNIGVANTTPARYIMNDGELVAGRALVVGRKESVGGIGEFLQSGGAVRSNTYISIGYEADSEGSYIMTGGTLSLSKNLLNLGSEGEVKKALLDISGGMATIEKGVHVGGTAMLRLKDDGKLVTAYVKGVHQSAAIEFDGGTLQPVADNATFINSTTNVFFRANGVTIDTVGHNIAFSGCVLNATPRTIAINLTGGGSIDFTNTKLRFTDKLNGSFTFATADDGVFTSVPTLDPSLSSTSVVLSEDGKTIKIIKAGLMIFVK
ncbi:MAG: hypothetical protein IKL96_02915 [Kiritimatiellae bacterium]|nr:hypothetical protein [Kiritimatiellia bacterium]